MFFFLALYKHLTTRLNTTFTYVRINHTGEKSLQCTSNIHCEYLKHEQNLIQFCKYLFTFSSSKRVSCYICNSREFYWIIVIGASLDFVTYLVTKSGESRIQFSFAFFHVHHNFTSEPLKQSKLHVG